MLGLVALQEYFEWPSPLCWVCVDGVGDRDWTLLLEMLPKRFSYKCLLDGVESSLPVVFPYDINIHHNAVLQVRVGELSLHTTFSSANQFLFSVCPLDINTSQHCSNLDEFMEFISDLCGRPASLRMSQFAEDEIYCCNPKGDAK